MLSNSLVLRSAEPASTHRFGSVMRSEKARKGIAYMFLTLLFVLFFSTNSFSPTSSAPEKAYANILGDALCANEDERRLPIVESWPGSSSRFLGIDKKYGVRDDATQVRRQSNLVVNPDRLTAYEWYGTAGMSRYYGGWVSSDIDSCALTDRMSNMLGSGLMSMAFTAGEIMLTIISWSLSTSLTTNLLVGKDDGIITKVIEGFETSLYQNYLLPIVMFAALWIGWQGLVKRRGTEAIQGAGWMVLSAAAAVAFFIWPTEIARTTDNAVGTVGTTVISAMATPAGQEGMCSLPDGALDREIRSVQCSLWATFIYSPWAANQFGSLADAQIPAEAVADAPSTFRPNTSQSRSLALYFLDLRTNNYAEVKTTSYRSLESRKQQWDVFKTSIKASESPEDWSVFSGKTGTGLAEGMVAFTALLFGIVPLGYFSLTLILQQVTFIMLMLVAPLFLLAGLMPGMGRRIMLGWVELTASTVIKRLITYVVAGLLLTAIGIINATGGLDALGAVGRMIMIALVGVAAVTFRKTIIDQYSKINLGGDQSLIKGSEAQETKQRMKGMFTEPLAGIGKAKAEGKSALGGFVGGAVRNIGKKGEATGFRDASRAALNGTKAPSRMQNLKFASTMEEKNGQLNKLRAMKKKREQENMFQNSGSMDVNAWKEYVATNPGATVPRPKNKEYAAELQRAGLTLRDQVDPKLEREIGLLENELAEIEGAGAKKIRQVNKALQNSRQESERALNEYHAQQEQLASEIDSSGSSSSAMQANAHARRQAIENQRRKTAAQNRQDGDSGGNA